MIWSGTNNVHKELTKPRYIHSSSLSRTKRQQNVCVEPLKNSPNILAEFAGIK